MRFASITMIIVAVLFTSLTLGFAQGDPDQQMSTTLSAEAQAAIAAANAKAEKANARAYASDQKLAVGIGQMKILKETNDRLRAQIQDEQDKERKALSRGDDAGAARHRQYRVKLQSQLRQIESGGPAAKWALSDVNASLKVGAEGGGVVGDQLKPNVKSRNWQKAASQQQLAVLAIRQLTQINLAENRAADRAKKLVDAHNSDENLTAHQALFKAEAIERQRQVRGLRILLLVLSLAVIGAYFFPRRR